MGWAYLSNFPWRSSLLLLALQSASSAPVKETQQCVYTEYGLNLIAGELGVISPTVRDQRTEWEKDDIHATNCMIVKLLSKNRRSHMAVRFCVNIIIIFL